MTQELRKYEFLLEAVTPIAHHAETHGNMALAFRRKIRQHDGSWAHVPYITGDAMRHQLRESIAYAFLDAAGLLDEGQLTEAALRLLFAGGMVTGRGDASSIKLDQYREMIELIPALGLLGGCASNRVIEGRLTVDDALLVCHESARLLPEWVLREAYVLDTCRAHVTLEQRVRMDPTLSPTKRKLLSAADQVSVQTRLLASEAAHDANDPVERDDTKSSMLPRSYETIAQGSLFSWGVQAWTTSDLEYDTFCSMVGAFLSNARVGGKRATGHGSLRAIKAFGVIVNRPSERMDALDTTALAGKIGSAFRAHVAERKERIVKFLREVDA
jgi:hypothetical protein